LKILLPQRSQTTPHATGSIQTQRITVLATEETKPTEEGERKPKPREDLQPSQKDLQPSIETF
jgi:hypothetical protein